MSLTKQLLDQAKTDQLSKADVKRHTDWRWSISSVLMAVLLLLMAIFAKGNSVISFQNATGWFKINNLSLPASPTLFVLAVPALAGMILSIIWTKQSGKAPGWLAALVGLFFLWGLLVFIVAGREGSVLPLVSLLQSTMALSIPLVFGSMSGLVCERTGVINIAIEGQILIGAFFGAVVASMTSSPYIGIIFAPLGGMLVSALLALFAIKYRVDHIIVGVVLVMLVSGVTSFLYGAWIKYDEQHLNRAIAIPRISIPVLSDIPVVGPVLFKQTILVYIMYIVVGTLAFLLFHSRWGLRTRACGEHPKAADTVGIKVNSYRWRNVLIAGALAGIGGAYFTLGAGLSFTKDISAGNGYIALAAMILGKWNPFGAVAASFIFGFSTALGYVMQSVNSPIPTDFLLMIPYLVTILAVAGFVGRVRPPAMEGKPYP